MSFQPSDPTTLADWEPLGPGGAGDGSAIGAILRGEGESSEDPPPTEDPTVNVVGDFRRAFPGGGDILPAMGAGATALSDANRANVIIYQVTNRDDSGAGSFRQAMLDAWNEADQDALKIIVFRTGGYIDMTSTLQIPEVIDGSTDPDLRRFRNVYIAGQTAPGDGVCFRRPSGGGMTLDFYGYQLEDLVIRGLRFRYGYRENGFDGMGNILVRQCQRTMYDMCSLSWASGRNLHVGVQNIGRSLLCMEGTAQNCMFYEPFRPHSTTLSNWQTDGEMVEKQGDGDGKIGSVYRNFMGSGQRRAPNCGTYTEVVNNIMWNLREDAGWIGTAGDIVDYLANIIVNGPLTQSANRFVPFALRSQDLFDDAQAYAGGWYPSYFLEKNLWLARPGSGLTDPLSDVNADNWSNDIPNRGEGAAQGLVDGHGATMQGYIDDALAAGTDGFTGLLEFRRNKRMWEIASGDREWGVCQHFGEPVFPIVVDNPNDVIEDIKANAGCAWRVNSAGQWVRDRRDAADARQITEYESGDAVVDNISKLEGTQSEVEARFPYPVLSIGSAPTDSNGDGIPDDYYVAMGYDPADASRAGEIGHDGYCFAENYINGRDHHTGAMRFA